MSAVGQRAVALERLVDGLVERRIVAGRVGVPDLVIARDSGLAQRLDLPERDLGERQRAFVLVACAVISSFRSKLKLLGHAFTARRAVRNARNLGASDERAVNKRMRAARATMQFTALRIDFCGARSGGKPESAFPAAQAFSGTGRSRNAGRCEVSASSALLAGAAAAAGMRAIFEAGERCAGGARRCARAAVAARLARCACGRRLLRLHSLPAAGRARSLCRESAADQLLDRRDRLGVVRAGARW